MVGGTRISEVSGRAFRLEAATRDNKKGASVQLNSVHASEG